MPVVVGSGQGQVERTAQRGGFGGGNGRQKQREQAHSPVIVPVPDLPDGVLGRIASRPVLFFPPGSLQPHRNHHAVVLDRTIAMMPARTPAGSTCHTLTRARTSASARSGWPVTALALSPTPRPPVSS